MSQKYGYVKVPSVFMRENPSAQSKVVSEAYYSEEVFLGEETKDWIFIQTAIDQYPGWVEKNNLLLSLDLSWKEKSLLVKVKSFKAHLYEAPDTEYGPILTVPFSSLLKLCEEVKGSGGRWLKVSLLDGREGFIQSGDVQRDHETHDLSKEDLSSFAKRFLGLPYTWGGRSTIHGFDCSGFVQMLYREMQIFLPRDAKDQYVDPRFFPVEEGELGDLVFFGPDEKQIRHVGLCLGNQKFIHATVAEHKPWIRENSLEEEAWKYSSKYPFRRIKRFF